MDKICVIKTGGTIGSVASSGVISLDKSNLSDISSLYNGKEAVEFDVFSPFFILSENISAGNMQDIYKFLKTLDTTKYKGIVLTHGTDTLAFTACYLSVMLENFPLPVVIASANYPLEYPHSNGKTNFSCGVEFILHSCESGIFVAYENPTDECKIHRGDLVLQCHGAEGYFDSFDDEIVGDFFDGKFRFSRNHKLHKQKFGLAVWKKFAPNYEKIQSGNGELSKKILPIKSVAFGDYSLFSVENCDAVLVECFHCGTVDTASENSILELCARACEKNIPVILSGASRGDIYDSVLPLSKFKNVHLFQGSFEMAYMLACLGAWE
ncbi:MAG: asparaginase domain-containing protein [Bacillota bacterium]